MPVFLLWFWVILGGIIRLTNLGAKPSWTDEFATLLYSRAENYNQLPYDEILTGKELLAPLLGYPDQGVTEAAHFLIHYDNHPPLYFMVVNLWQRLFPLEMGGYISIDGVRLLSVLLSLLGIGSLYGLAKWLFQSEKIAQLTAALMAFSPFDIYLAQEARHYTLIGLFVIASLGFSFLVLRQIKTRQALSWGQVFVGIVLCGAGLLVHYFFVLTLLAEAIALGWWMVTYRKYPIPKQWWRLGTIILTVGLLGLIWKTQVLPDSYGTSMTSWIRLDRSDWLAWLSPVFQLLATVVTMVMLLPIEVDFLPTVIVCGAVMIVVGIRFLTLWRQGIKAQSTVPQFQDELFFLCRFVGAAWGLFGVLSFGLGIDITRGARYSFVYFPAVILLGAVGLSYFWQRENIRCLGGETMGTRFPQVKSGTKAIAFMVLISFCSALTVVHDWGYQKYYHPDKIVDRLATATQPVLMVLPRESTVQIGEMMGIAWEQQRRALERPVFFAFVPKQDTPAAYTDDLDRISAQFSQTPFELWSINLFEPIPLSNCRASEQVWVSGYYSDVYQCGAP
ncbi:glycosyltransferase family 39 protein [Picosynechococcus sp. PCC 8807]|uniref:glycosyltransferase family 39 protein n=1 Tax=Picosynechococcus sp. PCC 8807 TaxID=195248 RepID=UPI00081034C9|nr:glycosyltransferase family 39 protein [Picosynechococcus sp. PCC 8807]ANV90123.1 hypothetical protein AWQ24_05490 [Picosynechococcus sp. PCC 8807]